MADKYTEIGGTDATSDTWDLKEPIEGVYESKKTDVGKYKSNLYTLKTAQGPVAVWGSAVLDDKMDQVPTGTEVKIEFLGKKKTEDGSTEYKDFSLQAVLPEGE